MSLTCKSTVYFFLPSPSPPKSPGSAAVNPVLGHHPLLVLYDIPDDFQDDTEYDNLRLGLHSKDLINGYSLILHLDIK